MEFDKELVNNYGFDLRRLRSSELIGLPYLVRKDTPGWNFAVEHKTLVSFQEGFQAVLESNLPIWTINGDPYVRHSRRFITQRGVYKLH